MIPNALSRLPNTTASEIANAAQDPDVDELNALYACAYTTTTLVKLSPKLRQEMLDNYKKNPAWNKVLVTLKANELSDPEDEATLPFLRDQNKLI